MIFEFKDALVGLLPFRCGDFDVVEPNLGTAAVPLSGNRSHFTAIVPDIEAIMLISIGYSFGVIPR